MKTKLLYVILFSAIGIAITINVAYAGTLQSPLVASPSNNFAGRGAQYMVQFTIPNSPAGNPVTSIDINFPAGYNFQYTNMTFVEKSLSNTLIPGSLVNTNSTNIRFTPTSTFTVSGGEIITMFLGRMINTSTPGSYHLSYVVHYGAILIDTSPIPPTTAPFSITNTLGGITWSPTDNNISLGGNISSSTANQFKITTSSNVPICIGAC